MSSSSRGRPRRDSLELLARARELAGKLGGQTSRSCSAHELEPRRELGRHGAEVVYTADGARRVPAGALGGAVHEVLAAQRPHVLLIPATGRGRDYGPRAAGELELGMTGDCVGVDIAKAGRLLQQKPAYGGNIVSVIMGATTPQLATVRPRMYEPLEPRDDAAPEVRALEHGALPEPRVRGSSGAPPRGELVSDIDEAETSRLRRPRGRRRRGDSGDRS